MGISNEKLKKLQSTFGKEAISKLGENKSLDLHFISSGSLALDLALGGGFPLGRIVELGGPESSGKTTLALHAIADAQQQGLTCAFIDAEHALDPVYARSIGVDTDELLISQPNSGEEAFNLLEALIDTEEVKVIVLDSTANLTPEAEIDGEMDSNQLGLQARLMSKGLRKNTAKAKKHDCLVIFISQIREKIGVMFGSPEKMGVGNALKFYASQRVDIRRSTQTKGDDGIADGNLTRAKVIKNKIAPPFRTAEYNIKYGIGIDKQTEIIDLAVEMKIIDKAGSWFSYEGSKLGQGKAKVIELLQDNPELMEEIKENVLIGLSQQ